MDRRLESTADPFALYFGGTEATESAPLLKLSILLLPNIYRYLLLIFGEVFHRPEHSTTTSGEGCVGSGGVHCQTKGRHDYSIQLITAIDSQSSL